MTDMALIMNARLMRVLNLTLLILCGISGCSSLDFYDGPTVPVLIRAGDSVSKIADRHGLENHDLIAINQLKSPYKLTAGKTILIPKGATKRAAFKPAPKPVITKTKWVKREHKKAIYKTKPKPRPAPIKVAKKVVKPRPKPAPKTKPKPIIAKGPTPTFAWPIRGRILSRFGPKPGGLKNDGINIACKSGTAVKASSSGVVAYAGNQLKGFGYLVIIKHPQGWSTAYAHNSKLLVKKGQKVSNGQTIALSGMLGNVKVPQLHFEIRYKGRPVNPQFKLR